MTTRQRRTSANPGNFIIETDDDRVYTEDDYAAKPSAPLPDEWADENAAYVQPDWTTDAALPDEAFLPDEEGLPPEDLAPEDDADYADGYQPLFQPHEDFTEDFDPLAKKLLKLHAAMKEVEA